MDNEHKRLTEIEEENERKEEWEHWEKRTALWDLVKKINEDPISVDYIIATDELLVIQDGYPKANIHWLILPRVMIEHIDYLKSEHIPLLKSMKNIIPQLVEKASKIYDVKKYGPFQYLVGFHAIPSMKLMHLHFISSDLNGEKMIKPEHWISFTSDFLIPLDSLINLLQEKGSPSIDKQKMKIIKQNDMICPKCGQQFKQSKKNVTLLKNHFQICRLT